MNEMNSRRMIKLADSTLSQINSPNIQLPGFDHSKLPVKVLQFGTGVLLRGLCDHVIDKANRAGIFNGRVTVIKSTNTGSTDAFADQDNLYTVQLKGIQNKELVDTSTINTSIAKVLSAKDEWDAILKEAENPELKVIISNTTEVGLQLVKEDIGQQPPVSFPGKLLALLHHRYQKMGGDEASGLVIVPTELLPDNGTILKSIIKELSAFNQLDKAFESWVDQHNFFCNSLVDRIVTGKPSEKDLQLFEQTNGYSDDLLIVAEPYCLWAIEGNEKVRSILSFEQADNGVFVIPDIELNRELKLRLLNGTHTLSCAAAFVSGFDVVNVATNDDRFTAFLESLMSEIRAAMPVKVDEKMAAQFAEGVLDRFKNPYIEHLWINIAQQYTTKIITRVLPILKQHYKLYNSAPVTIAKGFAAYIYLISKVQQSGNEYHILHNDTQYAFKDDKVGPLVEKYRSYPSSQIAAEIFGLEDIWGEDLNNLPNWADTVQHYFNKLNNGELIINE